MEKKHVRIDVHNDALMIELGLRQPKVEVYNFAKTKKEHILLSEAKLYSRELGRSKVKHNPVFTHNKTTGKIVVNFNNSTKSNVFKTTHSAIINKSEIITFINSIGSVKDVTKCTFNGNIVKLAK